MSSNKSTKGPGNRPALRPMVRGNSIKNPNRAADPKRTDLRDKNKSKYVCMLYRMLVASLPVMNCVVITLSFLSVNRLKMQNAKPVRAKDGSLISGAFMSKTVDAKVRNPPLKYSGGFVFCQVKRIQPDRRWFGNTRTVGQKQLEDFRDEMKTKVNDPYTFVMRTNKLPMGLLTDKFKVSAIVAYLFPFTCECLELKNGFALFSKF